MAEPCPEPCATCGKPCDRVLPHDHHECLGCIVRRNWM